MANSSELRAECVRNNLTLEALASKIGVNPATLHRKIKGDTEFNRNELQIIKNELNLGNEQFLNIFFAS